MLREAPRAKKADVWGERPTCGERTQENRGKGKSQASGSQACAEVERQRPVGK